MFNANRKIAAVMLAAALAPWAVACEGDATTRDGSGTEGTDPVPGTVETPRPEE